MPRPAPCVGLVPLLTLCWIGLPVNAQGLVLAEGATVDALRITTIHPATGAVAVVLPDARIRVPHLLGRTSNESGELDASRALTRSGLPRIEMPGGDRLFVYERNDTVGHGVLLVPAFGAPRVLFEAPEAIDLPLAVGSDRRHLAFVRDELLYLLRLDGSVFPGTGLAWRTIAVPPGTGPGSLVLGPTHAFWVVEAAVPGQSDSLWRCTLDTSVLENVTPASSSPFEIDQALALAGNGSLVAFLRDFEFGERDVAVVGPSGSARLLPMPERDYRPTTWVPFGEGHPYLQLNGDGTRLLCTEVQAEDELFVVDTAVGGVVRHVTRDDWFAPYIGVHILPRFRGDRLVFASGHVGWRDWYALQPGGTVLGLSVTGSSEPPFLLGSLDILARYSLGNGMELATERHGATDRLRVLDLASGSAVLFTDLVAPLGVGAASNGHPDLRVIGSGGERLLSGATGALLFAVPGGIQLTDPLRSASGWRATFVHLPSGLGVLALRLPDGSLVVGGVGLSPPQLVALAGDGLAVVWVDRIDTYGLAGSASMALPAAAVRVALAGVGN